MSSDKDRIKTKALELGFDDVRVTPAELPPEVRDRFRAFVEAGHHGTMAWLEDRLDKRAQPRELWPEVRTAIVLGVNYGPEGDPLSKLDAKSTGNLSVYAGGDDYHELIKKRLKTLGRWMAETFGCELKVFVDTAPVAEKPLAEKA
ncbi:MAG: QueG-associated DUF1730 domain-containing protein, partial [Parvularcula sp.]|nr:QueG-associated DUF1730 domain-containing protein [Parvularcula sp.]